MYRKFFMLFFLTNIFVSGNMAQSGKKIGLDELTHSITLHFNIVFYPLYEKNLLKDSSFFVSAVFTVGNNGDLDSFSVINTLDSSLLRPVNIILTNVQKGNLHISDSKLYGKKICYKLFCFVSVLNENLEPLRGNSCTITLSNKDIYLQNYLESEDNVIIMPVLPCKIIFMPPIR